MNEINSCFMLYATSHLYLKTLTFHNLLVLGNIFFIVVIICSHVYTVEGH